MKLLQTLTHHLRFELFTFEYAFAGGSPRKAGASLAFARAMGWQTGRWRGVISLRVATGSVQKQRISNKILPEWGSVEFLTALLSLGTRNRDHIPLS